MSTVAIVLIVCIPTVLISIGVVIAAILCCKRKGACCWKTKPLKVYNAPQDLTITTEIQTMNGHGAQASLEITSIREMPMPSLLK